MHTPSRRAFVSTLACVLGAAGASRARADTRPIEVLTSYPDTVIARVQEAFERSHAHDRLHVQWRMPFDALPYLRRPEQSGIDVYWAPSVQNFTALAAQGALRRLDLDDRDLPARIGHTRLTDPEGRYTATEMAGYGFAVNTRAFDELGIEPPRDWPDLVHPALAGRIALPDPVRVGFAPVMIDIVLQAWGWERGWALWSEIAGQSTLAGRGDALVGDAVVSGRAALAPTIDFFAASAIAQGEPLRFIYPEHTGINPAQVGIMAASANPEGALRFVRFLLSPEGQAILADPAIRKLPVRPSVYAQLPAGYFDPFTAASKGQLDYDEQAGLPRLGLVTAIFGAMLSSPHEQLVTLWSRVRKARQRKLDVTAVRRLLGTPPLSADEAQDPALRARFGRDVTAPAAAPGPMVTAWRSACARRRDRADAMLRGLGV